MQRIEVIGVLFQYLPIAGLGLRQKTTLMTVQRVRQRPGDVVASLGSGR